MERSNRDNTTRKFRIFEPSEQSFEVICNNIVELRIRYMDEFEVELPPEGTIIDWEQLVKLVDSRIPTIYFAEEVVNLGGNYYSAEDISQEKDNEWEEEYFLLEDLVKSLIKHKDKLHGQKFYACKTNYRYSNTGYAWYIGNTWYKDISEEEYEYLRSLEKEDDE